jgi:hypothetical protein
MLMLQIDKNIKPERYRKKIVESQELIPQVPLAKCE